MMITSEVVLNDKGCVVRVDTTGHALPNLAVLNPLSPTTEQFLALCTAISTVEQQFFYALKELVGCQFELTTDRKRGSFQLSLPVPSEGETLPELPAKNVERWKTLSQAFMIGYKMIEETYGRKQFHVTWNTTVKKPTTRALY